MSDKTRIATFKGKTLSRIDSQKFLVKAGDFILMERGVPRMMVLWCPCGCGEDLLINLDNRSGPAWRLYSRSGFYTLSPSYWRDSECRSHFILWNNKIYWCYSEDEYEGNWNVSKEIENQVLETLKEHQFTHYLEIADACGLIFWECLQACKQLSLKGLCIANDYKKESFKKSTIQCK